MAKTSLSSTPVKVAGRGPPLPLPPPTKARVPSLRKAPPACAAVGDPSSGMVWPLAGPSAPHVLRWASVSAAAAGPSDRRTLRVGATADADEASPPLPPSPPPAFAALVPTPPSPCCIIDWGATPKSTANRRGRSPLWHCSRPETIVPNGCSTHDAAPLRIVRSAAPKHGWAVQSVQLNRCC